jgi:Ser/Thr protein kinase RdoA (MazF antagonist)
VSVRAADLERLLGTPLGPLVDRVGDGPIEVEPLSPLRPASPLARTAYRVRRADGLSLKVRRALTPAVAERAEAILREVDDPRFPRVLGRHGALLVEEWVEGTPLEAGAATDAHLAEAGDLLGRLHARATFSGAPLPVRRETAPLVAETASYLFDLRAVGAIDRDGARRLLEEAGESDPGEAETGICHDDLCAENMVVDAGGRLRVVDNERVSLAPLDGDLARTFYRWPMDARARERFLAAYAEHRNPGRALRDEPFWTLVTVVRSAHVRVIRLRRGEAKPLAALAALLERAGEPAAAPEARP